MRKKIWYKKLKIPPLKEYKARNYKKIRPIGWRFFYNSTAVLARRKPDFVALYFFYRGCFLAPFLSNMKYLDSNKNHEELILIFLLWGV
jgi:hypothetical protein